MTFDSSIELNVYLDAASPGQKDFGTLLFVSDLLTSFSAAEVKSYTTAAAIDADADVDDVTAAQVKDFWFSQNPHARTLKLGKLTAAYAALAADLVALAATDDDWYGLALGGTDASASLEANILVAAAYADAHNKLLIAQSDQAAVLTKTAGNVLEELAAYKRAAFWYYTDDAEYAGLNVAAFKLAADPDLVATTWADAPVAGVAADTALDDTEIGNILDQNGNCISTLKGVTCSGTGKLTSGKSIAGLVAADWASDRISTALATLRLNRSAQNLKIPFTVDGIALVDSTIRNVLQRGVGIGHFASLADEKADVTGTIRAPWVSLPTLGQVSQSDRTAGILRGTFGAYSSGEIIQFVLNMYFQGA